MTWSTRVIFFLFLRIFSVHGGHGFNHDKRDSNQARNSGAQSLYKSLLTNSLNLMEEEKSQLQDQWEILNILQDLGNDYLAPTGEFISERCSNHSKLYQQEIARFNVMEFPAEWAMRMFDANPKFPPSGIMQGNIIHFPGSFEGCQAAHGESFSGQYCLMGIYLPQSTETRQRNGSQLSSQEKELIVQKMRLGHNNRHFGGRSVMAVPQIFLEYVRLGWCIPDSCTTQDASFGLSKYLIETGFLLGLNFEAYGYALDCKSADFSPPLTTGDYCVIVLLGLIGIVIGVCTFLDMGSKYVFNSKKQLSKQGLVEGFSLYHNLKKLFNTKTSADSFDCINGIRFLSMTWVLIGHTFQQFTFLNYIDNFAIFFTRDTIINTVAFTAIWNAQFSVDTFFLIGAILLAYLTMKELEKSGSSGKMWTMFYIHRYIRLTSLYAIVIALHCTLVKYLGYGPQGYLFKYMTQSCQDNWWTNLLYINNFVVQSRTEDDTTEYGKNFQSMCLGQTWYMANDMQFFIISPLIIYTLWKSQRAGNILCIALLLIATAIPFGISYADPVLSGDFNKFYIKPWNRFQPYILGLWVGSLLFRLRNRKKLPIPAWASLLLWVTAGAVGSATVYAIYPFNYIVPGSSVMTRAGSAVYTGVSRLSWSLAVSWVIVACVKKHGGPINSLLSWSGFVPLARMSYAMYLLHITVVEWFNSLASYTVTYNNVTAVYYILGHICFTGAAALCCVLLFEAPLLHLEKVGFALAGLGRMPQPREGKSQKENPNPVREENGEKRRHVG